jgi:hypothetical protein
MTPPANRELGEPDPTRKAAGQLKAADRGRAQADEGGALAPAKDGRKWILSLHAGLL